MSAPNVSRASPITSLAGQWPRGYTLAVASMLGLALVVQLGLYRLGFYRVTADESARSLLALRLSWHNALDPWVWPPFYKIFVGLFLKVHSDVFIVPRILVGIAGLVLLLAMLQLAETLFADRKVSLITTLLATPIPDRLIFSVTPMSDIFFYLFLVGASIFILRWLQTGGRWGFDHRLRLSNARLNRPLRGLLLRCHAPVLSDWPMAAGSRHRSWSAGVSHYDPVDIPCFLGCRLLLVVWFAPQSRRHELAVPRDARV